MITEDLIVARGDVQLRVRTWGPRAAKQTFVLVHGYPDTSAIWEPIARLLASSGDRRVVAYDVRGAGGSTAPRRTAAYALAELVADLAAVIDATCTGPVDLVGHDWGSIASWEAVTDPAFAPRLASFTSISGPCLDHVGQRLRGHPLAALQQATRSWYAGVFQLPFAPLAWRVVGPAWPRLLAHFEGVAATPGDRARDGAAGVALYRANLPVRLARPRDRATLVPVQLIVPTRDRFVDPSLYADLARWVPNLTRRDVVAGHWQVLADAPLVVRWLTETIVKRRLAIVTGAGSGIGRATALELVARGHAVVVADLDLAAARVTAELAGVMGGVAYARQVDVADAAAMTRFASETRRDLGVPDLVVNNAGIAVAGGFLATTEREWDRVIAVNVDGVARGCRLFARQMVDERRAGHIVNIASAAAFAPSRTFPAYATSKAAVVMLSECLRAELAPHAIGVSVICPGFVDTPITSATRYAGDDPAREAAKRRAAARLYRRRGLTAERVAIEIVDAIAHDRPLATVGIEASAMRYLSRFAPGLARRLARVDFSPGAP